MNSNDVADHVKKQTLNTQDYQESAKRKGFLNVFGIGTNQGHEPS